MTPVKDHERSGKSYKIQDTNKLSRNVNPMAHYSPKNKIREREFVVAKKRNKDSKKEEKEGALSSNVEWERFGGGNVKKCLCVAYETLRASEEEFLKNKSGFGEFDDAENLVGEEIEMGGFVDQNIEDQDVNVTESPEQNGSSTMKRRRANA